MIVRIRFGSGTKVSKLSRKPRRFAVGAALQLCAHLLNRYAKGGETAAS